MSERLIKDERCDLWLLTLESLYYEDVKNYGLVFMFVIYNLIIGKKMLKCPIQKKFEFNV